MHSRVSPVLVLAVAVGVALGTCACSPRPLLSGVSFSDDLITPNADRDRDILVVSYDLSRAAFVSVYFVDDSGERFFFRDHVRYGPSVEVPYEVYFAGVVDGYVLPAEDLSGFTIEKRVLRDGDYTWVIEAADEVTGATEQVTGPLAIRDADTALPELRGFSIHPPVFSPNRDGIDDRATINVDLKKDVAELSVYLTGPDGVRYHVEEDESVTMANAAGWHEFDYDAGVDLGADPPADGVYTVTMRAQDTVGQWTVATGHLTIEDGGVPRVYILNAEVEWSAGSIALGETLFFTLTVENDSATPVRTSGPPPGTVYDSGANYATMGEYEQSGAFRVAIHCETSPTDHPWRWAIGSADDLIVDEGGHSYLPGWKRSVVTGGIRFVDVVPARNPQYCYASLIHEDVEISMVNYRVDPVFLKIQVP